MPSSESRLQTEHSLHRAARVKDVTLTWVKMPLRPLAEKHLLRQNYHYCFSEVCTVTLDCGIRGVGETMPFYTWGRVTDRSMKYVMGKSAVEVMWDDAVGPGLQQAMFDAVGKLTAVPVHHLIGKQARRSLDLSWPGFPFWPSWSVYDSRLPAAMQRFSHCCQVRYSFRCRSGLRMLADHGVPAKPEGPLATPLPRRPSATRVRWLFRAVDVTLRAQVAPKSAAACRRTTSGSDAPPQAATNNIARASRAARPSSSADAASSSATSF